MEKIWFTKGNKYILRKNIWKGIKTILSGIQAKPGVSRGVCQLLIRHAEACNQAEGDHFECVL
jgi:hypothetical protein